MLRYKTLFSRIVVICIVVLVSAILLLNIFTATRLRKQKIDDKAKTLRAQATQISHTYEMAFEEKDEVKFFYSDLENIAYRESCVIWVVDSFGTIKEISEEGTAYENHADAMQYNMEFLAARLGEENGAVATAYESASLTSAPLVTAGILLSVNGVEMGSVYLHVMLTDIAGTVRVLAEQSIFVFLGGLLLAGVLSFFVSRGIAKPLYAMNQAAKELARGNFKERIEVRDTGDELGQLTQTFNMMAEELEKYEDTRESFVGNVSHELKSPLTAIQGFVQGMLDGTIDNSERDQYLEIVLLETKRMNTLITDLLDLVKIESDQFIIDMTVWDINELIRRILINYISKIEEKHIELAINIPEGKTDVLADQGRIAQVLTNLLDNAVKFAEEGGTVKIWSYESEGKVLINIANSGQVIPKEDLRFIFDRFFKADKSHNRKVPGTGIGLSIVKEIINRHNERIWVNSRPEAGTVFTFTLTLASETKETAPVTRKQSVQRQRSNRNRRQ
ncbi:MAG: sensor histidine kinase [Christensenellaceae bacterium]|jgi:signal transduction histidine kinase